MKNFWKNYFAAFVILTLLFFANQGIGEKINFNPIKPTAQRNAQLTDEQQAILAVRKAKAAVVNIVGYSKRQNGGNLPPSVDMTLGTGFIIGSNGLVVSNSHVLSKASAEFSVVFADGTEYPATVLGTDRFNDVGLLQIQAQGLPAAALGDSDALETGQTVFTIGNSLGKYQFSVTRGVISGLGRLVDPPLSTSDDPQPRLTNLIQTDAAINPGNSGGPLVNLAGEVVGMNTIIDRNGEGLGFAVPINTVKKSVEQLQSLGKVSRPYLGVNFLTINKAAQIQNSLTVDEGALVVSVSPGSPAAQAGIRSDDVILKLDDERLTQLKELDLLLQSYEAGDQVFVTVLRSGETLYLPVVLGDYNSRK